MGVPGFFLWLWKNYKGSKFVFSKSQLDPNKDKKLIDKINKLDYLLIDANCLIHPVCFKVLADNPNITNFEKIETKMIIEVIKYIEKLINFVKPLKGIYLAIDGVAPIAKIKQQRSRRFKSVYDKNLYDNIRRKYNKEIPFFWNNSAISPGTKFMKKLHDKIIVWSNNFSKESKKQVIYSSCYTPTEGEHKLLQFIRNNQNGTKIEKEYTYITYGLDADLIFLILSTGIKNTFLLREACHFNKSKTDILNYVSINTMIDCIINKIKEKIINDDNYDSETSHINFLSKLNNKRLIDDFIFICYLMGNDFLPHLPSLNIYEGAIDYLIDTYITILLENFNGEISYIINSKLKEKINQVFFNDFIKELSLNEESLLSQNFANKPRRFKCSSSDQYDKEIHKIENLQFRIDDPVKLGSDSIIEYKKRYYKHYFYAEPEEIKELSNEMVYSYLEGLKWVTEYYFDKCPSWDWYYPYDNPPFLEDIRDNIYDFKNINFKLGVPLKPYVQLLAILPKQTNYLLPKCLRKIVLNLNSSLSHLYPISFDLDYLNKKKFWMCIPKLPSLEINSIKRSFKKYSNKLTKEEIDINVSKELFIF